MTSQPNRFTAFALIIGIFVLFFLYVLQYSSSLNVFAETVTIGGNGYSCTQAANRWKINNGNVATLPDGYSFESIIVKAGQNCIPVYPTNTAPTCYSVSIVGNTATVTKIGEGRTCQDVSHLEGTYNVVPTSTPTPTPDDPTDTPTPTPTNVTPTPEDPTSTPTPTPECEEQCDPTNTPTPTTEQPTNTPTPGASNTPTPGPSNTPTPGPSATPGPGPTATPEPGRGGGEVLGATTLAATGTFEDTMLNFAFVAGALLFALTARRYVREA